MKDIYGHAVGDDLLQAISQRLLDHFRNTDFVARWGDDAFACRRDRKWTLLANALLACLLVTGPAMALDVEHNYYSLSSQVEFLEDPNGQLALEQLLADPDRFRFTQSSERGPTETFSPFWVKLELNFSQAALAKHYYLFTRVENLYDIRLYRPDRKGVYRETVTGNDHPASSREVPAPRYGFQIEPAPESVTLYLRIIGGPGTSNFPWDLVEQQTYLENADKYYAFDVAALSAIAALLLFNLCIALTLRTAEYLYYCAYVCSVMMALITVDGLGFYYLWPEYPALNTRALHSFNLLSSSMRLLTIMSFLGVAGFAPKMHRAALAVLALSAITFLTVNLVGISALPPYTATIPWAIGILYGFVLCGYAIRKRVKLALPLFITLVVPSTAAALQAVITVNSDSVSIVVLQLAKIGFVIHILLFSLCLAAHIKIETESRMLALHDSLTGLPGTTLLQERFELAARFSQRHGTKMAVFFLDLDGFKAVNDKLGHAAGDQLLVEVAQRLQHKLRRTDTVARIGGDEFVVLLTQLQGESAVHSIAIKLLATVAEPCQINGALAHVSASIGIAMHPMDGGELRILLSAADKAMYAAKHSGKNRYALATPGDQEIDGHPQPITAVPLPDETVA